MAILKALEYIQHLKEEEKTVLVYTDSRITLQSLQNQKRHTHQIDQIRNKILDMEQHEWKIDFSWIKAHVGQRGNELADRLAKEASRSKNIEECYNRVPKSTISRGLNEQRLKQWQNKWERTTKGETTKSFFPIIVDRLKLRINPTANFTAIVTGHGNIKTHLHKYKILQNTKCSCNKGEQTVDHIMYSCNLQEEERDRLKTVIIRSEQWPVSEM